MSIATTFHPVAGTPAGVERMFERRDRPLVLVSRHGLGDNIFCSPCFPPLRRQFERLFFCSSVNAYGTIFHESDQIETVYAGGINGQDLGLQNADGFVDQFHRQSLDLGVSDAWVYHFGLFEPHLPYEDERAFVKGRRNIVELFGDAPLATEAPRYHVAPDRASRDYVETVLDRWLPGRELIAIARYGHTDGGKNFGDDSGPTIRTAALLEERFPGRFKFLSLDYLPGDHAAEGRLPTVRSAYGFVPCDTGSLHHVLSKCRLLITVPTGAMLVGATIPALRLLTLWKTMSPFHFLDPQFGPDQPVHALVDRDELASRRFMAGWRDASRAAVERRWTLRVAPVTPESVAETAALILETP